MFNNDIKMRPIWVIGGANQKSLKVSGIPKSNLETKKMRPKINRWTWEDHPGYQPLYNSGW